MSMLGWWMVHTTVRPVLTVLRTARMTMAAARASRPLVGSSMNTMLQCAQTGARRCEQQKLCHEDSIASVQVLYCNAGMSRANVLLLIVWVAGDVQIPSWVLGNDRVEQLASGRC